MDDYGVNQDLVLILGWTLENSAMINHR
jgi:hypothetical protein